MADGFFGKFKTLIGIEEEDAEYEEEEYEEEEEELVAPPRRSRPSGGFSAAPSYDREERSRAFTAPKVERDSKVLSMQSSLGGSSSAAKKQQFKMIVTIPKSIDDCPKLVDNLRNRKPVIINLQSLPTNDARKIFDFLTGATYALDGNVQKVTEHIFIFAPENVDVMTSVSEKAPVWQR